MVFFNYSTMQMAAKVVYYGPGLCGKTTNLQHIYSHTSSGSRGEMVSLETETDRTLFFDLLPLEVGKIQGFKTRIQLYTVPGQVFYNTTRKLVLKGVDGIVFVADSQRAMEQANTESLDNLKANLDEIGLTFDDVPMVLQYNKRDLSNICSVNEMEESLNRESWASYEASALTGEGVFDTLRGISKLTLVGLKQRLAENSQVSPDNRSAPAATASTVPEVPEPRVEVVDNPPSPSGTTPSGSDSAPTAAYSVGSNATDGEATVQPSSTAPAESPAKPPRETPHEKKRGGVDILAELEKIRQQAQQKQAAQQTNSEKPTEEKGSLAAKLDQEPDEYFIDADDPSGAFEVAAFTTPADRVADQAQLDNDEQGSREQPAGTATPEPTSLPDHISGNGRREIDHSFQFHPTAETLGRATHLSFRLRIEDGDREVVDSFDEAIQVQDAESLEHLLLNLRIALDPTNQSPID